MKIPHEFFMYGVAFKVNKRLQEYTLFEYPDHLEKEVMQMDWKQRIQLAATPVTKRCQLMFEGYVYSEDGFSMPMLLGYGGGYDRKKWFMALHDEELHNPLSTPFFNTPEGAFMEFKELVKQKNLKEAYYNFITKKGFSIVELSIYDLI